MNYFLIAFFFVRVVNIVGDLRVLLFCLKVKYLEIVNMRWKNGKRKSYFFVKKLKYTVTSLKHVFDNTCAAEVVLLSPVTKRLLYGTLTADWQGGIVQNPSSVSKYK